MQKNLSEILSNPIKVENFSTEITFDTLNFQGNIYTVVYKTPVTLTASSVGKKKIHLTGGFTIHFSIPCDRCLEDVLLKFTIDIDRIIDFGMSEEDKRKELNEMSFIEGSNLDIDMLVYDEILLVLPMKVICSEDCKGICNICGTNLNKNTCDCDTTVLDPRMSVIHDIFNNFKEV